MFLLDRDYTTNIGVCKMVHYCQERNLTNNSNNIIT